MVAYLTHNLILHLIIFQTVVLFVILSNIRLTHRARRHPPLLNFPTVSVLVPARNEERNISACVRSLLALDYPFFEVLVLDDQSNDNTKSILEKISDTNSRLRILDGKPPLENHVGKNWACSQLASQAQGELLFFTDADTIHQPETLRTIVTALVGEQADLLTGFPRQEVRTWGERLLVPFFSWALLCLNPLELAYRFRLPALSSALGQMMLFRREAYLAVGGHNSVSLAIVDDLMLARLIKAAGLRWRVVFVADLISCRMYHGSSEAINGFAKNLFAAFDFRLLPYLFAFLWLALMFWEPLIVLIMMFFGQAPQASISDLFFCLGLSLLLWLIPYIEMRLPVGLALLYPITILANEIVASKSLQNSLVGRLFWKERKIARQPWKWF